jgi:thymidylate synthase (FAD)
MLLSNRWSPQQARSVLPNSLKTEIVTTANFREWRHILKLRTAKAAHPQMQEIMRPLLADLTNRLPVIFGDIPCEP